MIETALNAAWTRRKSLEEQIHRMTAAGRKIDPRYETGETHEEYVERLQRELTEAEREIELLTK